MENNENYTNQGNQQPYQQQPYQQQYQQPNQQQYQQPYQQPYADQSQYNNQGQYNAPTTQGGSDNSVLYAVLAYIPLLWLIGLLVKPEADNPYVKNHVNNGVIIDIASFGVGIIIGILYAIFDLIKLGAIASILGWVIGTGVFVLRIVGIINAAQKTPWELPLVGSQIKIIK